MNQHFVPRVYLKNFAEKKGKHYFIDAYDKKENRYFNANIKKICSETDYYTLEEGNKVAKDLFAIEKIYANGIEPLYDKAYHILTNNRVRWITDLQRAEIVMGLFQFYIRNPRLLNRSLRHHKSIILQMCEEARNNSKLGITYLETDFAFSEYRPEDIINHFEKHITKIFKEQHIGRINEISVFHIDAKFEVAIIKEESDSEFITSDNPLVLQDYLSNEENPLERSKEFVISLDKKTAVRLYHDNSKRNDEIRRYWIPSLSVVMHNNTVQSQASRFILANRTLLEENNRLTRVFLEDTSVEAKINVIRQILAKFPETEKNKDVRIVITDYLKKYDQAGTLTDLEQYEMVQKTRAIQNGYIRKIIN